MKNNLVDLLLKEVSLVDAGANPGARVVLFKRKGIPMTVDELKKEAARLKFTADEIAKMEGDPASFADSLARRQLQYIMDDVSNFTGALMDTLYSIVYSDEADKAGASTTAIGDMATGLNACVAEWLIGDPVAKAGQKQLSTDRRKRLRTLYKMLEDLLQEVEPKIKGGETMKFKKDGLAADVIAHIELLEKQVDELTADKTTALAKVETLEKAAKPALTEEDILKEASPAVRALMEKQNKMVEEMKKSNEDSAKIAKEERDLRILKECEAEVELFKSLSMKKDDATLIKSIREKLSKEETTRLMAILKAADTLILKSELFTDTGNPGGEGDVTFTGDFEAKCNEAVEKKDVKSFAEAIEFVAKREPALYEEYRVEQLERGRKSRS